jgi:hypothetical protein
MNDTELVKSATRLLLQLALREDNKTERNKLIEQAIQGVEIL